MAYTTRLGSSRGRTPIPLGLVVLLLLLVVGAVWWWMRRGEEPETVLPADTDLAADTEGFRIPRGEPLPDLPELAESDPWLRGMADRLSRHPEWASWLVPDDLVRRFVLVVVDLAGLSNPAANLPHLAPDDPFTVREEGGRTTIAPESYRRFDPRIEVLLSLDAHAVASLFQGVRPLVDEVYGELGITEIPFDEALALAIRNVLAVEPPVEPVEVVPDPVVYGYADPLLESSRGAEKLFYRMGRENTLRVQEKVGQIADALGIPSR